MNLCFTETIKDFPGYLICRDGRVISLNRKIGCRKVISDIKKSRIDNRGYPIVYLYANGKGMLKGVHRLIAEAFIPNPENKPMVLHKDDIKTNYNIDNLYWGDRSENSKDSYRNGRQKATKPWLGKFGKDHNRSKLYNKGVL
jgi:hypothetical protein